MMQIAPSLKGVQDEHRCHDLAGLAASNLMVSPRLPAVQLD